MKRFRTSRTALPLLAALLLLLSACGAEPSQPEGGADVQQPPQAEEPAGDAPETLAELCGADYQTYLTDTITMQMGNRMEKDPEVRYYPIEDNAPLSDYVTIDETTRFEVDEEGNPVIFFPAGTVTDEANGEQSFRIPKLYQ